MSWRLWGVLGLVGVHQVQEAPVLVQEAVSLTCGSCSFLCHEEGTGLVVHRLQVVPSPVLVLPLDLGSGGHGRDD